MLTTHELFDLSLIPEDLRGLLEPDHPWEVLARLDAFVKTIENERLGYVHPTAVIEGEVYLAASAKVAPHVYIEGPAWIGEGCQVKHGAYLRGGVVLAPGAAVGSKTEVKRSVFLAGAVAAHFNYVGDSVLGSGVNLGAGVKLANFKAFGNSISVEDQATGLRKLGAIVGDGASLGCNAVTTPGTIVGQNTVVYNCAVLRGVVPANTIVKLRQALEQTPLRELS